jgi:hypothetical protein
MMMHVHISGCVFIGLCVFMCICACVCVCSWWHQSSQEGARSIPGQRRHRLYHVRQQHGRRKGSAAIQASSKRYAPRATPIQKQQLQSRAVGTQAQADVVCGRGMMCNGHSQGRGMMCNGHSLTRAVENALGMYNRQLALERDSFACVRQPPVDASLTNKRVLGVTKEK